MEMKIRRQFQYPPYVFLTLITVSHPVHAVAIKVTQQIVQFLSQIIERNTTLLGPTPSPIMRLKNRYRYQCMIKYKREPNLKEKLERVVRPFEDQILKEDLQIIIDTNPYQFM